MPRWNNKLWMKLIGNNRYSERASIIARWIVLIVAIYFQNFMSSRLTTETSWNIAGNAIIIIVAIINLVITVTLWRGETPSQSLGYGAFALDIILISVLMFSDGEMTNVLFSLYFVPIVIAVVRFGYKIGSIYTALAICLYTFVTLSTTTISLPELIARLLSLTIVVGAVAIILRRIQGASSNPEYYNLFGLELEQHVEELTLLQEVSQILLRDLAKRDKIMDNVAAVIRRRLPHPYCALLLLDRAQNTMLVEAGWGIEKGNEFPIDEGGAGWVAKTGISLRTDDLNKEDRYGGVRNGMHSELCVPLKIEDHVIGVIDLQSPKTGAFSEHELRMLTTIANQVAVALENARLFAEIRRFNVELEQRVQERTEELATLYELARTVTSTLKLQEVTQLVIELVEQTFAVEAASMLLLDQETNELVFETALGVDNDHLTGLSLELGQGIAGHVALTKEASIVSNVKEDSHFYPWVDKITGFETKSVLCVPLLAKDRVLGVIELLNKRTGEFTDNDLERLNAFAASVAIAVENAALYTDLNRANEAKTEFVRFVSHEMRTPMTSIKGYADMLLSGMGGEITDTQRRFLTIVRANADRLSNLVSDLLDISRIETGNLRLHLYPLPMGKIAMEVIGTLEGLAEQGNLVLNLEFPDDLPEVIGDRDRMTQVLTNLVGNAIKYTPDNGQIWVRGTAIVMQNGLLSEILVGQEPFTIPPDTLPDGNWVLVSVKDTGIGIADEEQHKVFQKFFRADHERVRKRGGTGLGLNLTKPLVEAHNGQIWFDSELGAGSVFSFAIPIADSPHALSFEE